jgi:hypothetical protein
MRTLLLLGVLLVTTMTTGCAVQARGGAYARTDDRWDANRSGTTYRSPARPVVVHRQASSRPAVYGSTYSRPSSSSRPASLTSRPSAKCPPGHRWSDGQCHSTGKGNDPNKIRGNGKANGKANVKANVKVDVDVDVKASGKANGKKKK